VVQIKAPLNSNKAAWQITCIIAFHRVALALGRDCIWAELSMSGGARDRPMSLLSLSLCHVWRLLNIVGVRIIIGGYQRISFSLRSLY
jgi:hypothetical protein